MGKHYSLQALIATPAWGEEVKSPMSQAVITIRRPDDWVGRSLRSFIVRIDGHRAGRVKPVPALLGPAEFSVEAGEHTVAVSMDWVRSLPCRVTVQPGSRTELMIRARPTTMAWLKMTWPIVAAILIVGAIRELLLANTGLPDAPWWVRGGVPLALYVVVFTGIILAIPMVSGDYWAMWTLEPVGTISPQEAARG
jgi:hypothetical protein